MLPSLARLDASVQATVRPSLARRDDAHAREKAPLKVMHPPRRETGARDEWEGTSVATLSPIR